MPNHRPGSIVTFLADRTGPEVAPVVADVAWVLASAGRRVLAVDWNFERPALHRYLRPFLADAELMVTDGMLDYVLECARQTVDNDGEPVDLDATRRAAWPNILRYAVGIEWTFEGGGELDLLPAARHDARLEERAATFDWETFYRHRGGVSILEEARARLQADYDLVLIAGPPAGDDSLGLTTRVLPDILVPLLAPDEASIERLAREVEAAIDARSEIEVLPIPVAAAAAGRRRGDWQPAEARFAPYVADKRDWWRRMARPEREILPGHREVLAAAVDLPGQSKTTLAATERLADELVGGELGEIDYLTDTDRRKLLAVYAVPDRKLSAESEPTATAELGPPPTAPAPARRWWPWALAAATGGLVLALLFFLWWRDAPESAEVAPAEDSRSERLAARAEEIRVEPLHDPQLSLLVALEALDAGATEAAVRAVGRATAAIPARRPRPLGATPALGFPADRIAFSHDGGSLGVFYESAQFQDRRVVVYRISDAENGSRDARRQKQRSELEVAWRLSNGGAMALSDDFRWFAASDVEGLVRVAPASRAAAGGLNGRVIGSIAPPVVALALDTDGRRLAAANLEGAINVWELSGGDPLELRHEGVDRLAFGPRGSTLLALGLESARLWSLDRRRLTAFGAGINDPGPFPTAHAFSSDGRFVASGRIDGEVRVWRLPDGDRLSRADHGPAVSGMALAPDGALVAAAGGGTLGIWRTADGEPLETIAPGAIGAADFYPFGHYLLTASSDGRGAAIWELSRGVQVSAMPESEPLAAAAFDPSGSLAATATLTGAVNLWRVLGGPEAVAIRPPTRPMLALFDPSGERLAVAEAGGRASVWSADGESRLAVFESDATGLQAAIWSPDGGRVAVATQPGGRLWIWRPGTGENPRPLPGNGHRVSPGAFDPSGRRVVSGSAEGLARIWPIAGDGAPTVLRGHTGQVWSAAFSPDGRSVVTAAADRTARVAPADGGGGARVLAGHLDQVWSAEFSPDGKRVVTGSADGTARVWRIDSDTEPMVLAGHRGHVWSAAFSPDGARVATGGADGSVRLWTLDGSEPPRIVGRHSDQVSSVAFGPEGRRIVSSSADGSVRVWNWRPEDLRAQACARLSRNLTAEEWRREIGAERPYEPTCPGLPGGG